MTVSDDGERPLDRAQAQAERLGCDCQPHPLWTSGYTVVLHHDDTCALVVRSSRALWN